MKLQQLFKSKKAKGYSLTSFVYHLLLIVPLSLIILSIFFSYGAQMFDSLAPVADDVEETILFARVTNTCLRYDSGTTTSYANILDEQKFSNEYLQHCFGKDDQVNIRIRTELLTVTDKQIPVLSTGATSGAELEHYSLIRLQDGQVVPAKLTVVVG